MKCTVAVENRQEPRYSVFIKAAAKGISQFPGCIESISKTGCRIRFPDAENFDSDGEYEVTVYSQPNSEVHNFDLVMKPRWVCRNGSGATVGFSILRTPGYSGFLRYIEHFAFGEDDWKFSAD